MEPPVFDPIGTHKLKNGDFEQRSVYFPQNRIGPLKANWEKIYKPLVENLRLMVRYNIVKHEVEFKTCEHTELDNSIQKPEDFLKAYALGFDVDDALVLLRLDEIFIESFDVTDVKPLKGDHLSRAIGRVAGTNGKTRFTIENSTKTRIVLAGQKIHIMGSFQNIKLARDAICNLILGKPPSKIYGQMRNVASKMRHNF